MISSNFLNYLLVVGTKGVSIEEHARGTRQNKDRQCEGEREGGLSTIYGVRNKRKAPNEQLVRR